MSPESPNCPIVRQERTNYHLGGAANVAYWLAKGTEHEVTLITHMGPHEEMAQYVFNQICWDAGISLPVWDLRATTKQGISIKERICRISADGQTISQLARIDQDVSRETSVVECEGILSHFQKYGYDVVVVADYAKSVFQGRYGEELLKGISITQPRHFCLELNRLGTHQPIILVNSKTPRYWDENVIDFLIYNALEGEQAWPGRADTNPHQGGMARYKVMTANIRGVYLYPGCEEFKSLVRGHELVDVTGAGDAFMAGMVAEIGALRKLPVDLEKRDLAGIIYHGQQWARHCCMQVGCGEPPTERTE